MKDSVQSSTFLNLNRPLLFSDRQTVGSDLIAAYSKANSVIPLDRDVEMAHQLTSYRASVTLTESQDRIMSRAHSPRKSQLQRTRVAIVDEDPTFLSRFSALDQSITFICMSLGSSFKEVITLFQQFIPQVLLLSETLLDSTELVCLREEWQEMACVVLMSALPDQIQILKYISCGACGWILKSAATSEFEATILCAKLGGLYIPKESRDLFTHTFQQDRQNPPSLTDRESEIMSCLRQRKCDKEIADELHIEVGTVHSHLHRIFNKLKVHSRRAAVRQYQRSEHNLFEGI